MQFFYKLLTICILVVASSVETRAMGIAFSENLHNPVLCPFDEPQQNEVAISDVETHKEKGKKKPAGRKSKKVSFETFEENYAKACDYYQRNLFISAARLFEELYPLSMGTPLADTILFAFADCYYQNKDYEMAAYHFKEYANRYSGNSRAEEAHFQAIKAISQLSPEYSLDQTETYYAIEEINAFIRAYPKSEHMEKCNALLDEMREKLAHKSFEILKLYYNTENYKAAQIAARNFLKEFASSTYADDAYAILVKNNYEFACHSVESKKLERFTACIDAFESMRINYPYARQLPELQKLVDDAKAKISKINHKSESKKSTKKVK